MAMAWKPPGCARAVTLSMGMAEAWAGSVLTTMFSIPLRTVLCVVVYTTGVSCEEDWLNAAVVAAVVTGRTLTAGYLNTGVMAWLWLAFKLALNLESITRRVENRE